MRWPCVAAACRPRATWPARLAHAAIGAGFSPSRGSFEAGSEQHCSNGPAPAPTRTVGRGLLSLFPPPHFRLISPTHQHWGPGARLKALVGAQPAESPEGHDAVLPGPGVAGKRLHVLTEYDQQGSHCSSPGNDHALATHRPRRWGFEQLRDVRGPTRQETPARIAGEARFFRRRLRPPSPLRVDGRAALRWI